MALGFHKKGQGGVARTFVGVAIIAIALFGAVSLRNFIVSYTGTALRWSFGIESISVEPGMFVGTLIWVAVSLAAIWAVSSWVRLVDFLILTESELRKVSWPSKDDLRHQTVVVLLVALAFGVFIFAADFIVQRALELIQVLPQ